MSYLKLCRNLCRKKPALGSEVVFHVFWELPLRILKTFSARGREVLLVGFVGGKVKSTRRAKSN